MPSDGRIVEIGMGDGQLFEHLPSEVLARTLHTEPLAAASRAFRRQHPEVQVVQAPAERLPCDDNSISAVLGLCVMDVVPDGVAVASELRRVLRPGGRFIHWLDMSTVLAPVVEAIATANVVPLPNVFTDPSAAAWPEDLFLIPREQLALIVAILQQHDHAMARPLAQYLATFAQAPIAVERAAAELAQLQDDAELRKALRAVFRAAFELASSTERQQLAAFQGRPIPSSRFIEQRLRSWFGESAGFRVEEASVACTWDLQARRSEPFSYLSSCVGEQRALPRVPAALLCADAQPPSESQRLSELGVFVFVATRI